MAELLIDRSVIEINGKECQGIEEMSIRETDSAAAVVKTMRRLRRPIGYKQGIADLEVTLRHKILIPREVDYVALKQTEQLFTIAYRELAGQTNGDKWILQDCRVTEISRTYNAEGDAMDEVTILALVHTKEPFGLF